jgi:hypothetical protein
MGLSLTHLFRGACLFLLAVVVPDSLFGEVGAGLVFNKPVFADREAVLCPMGIAENVKVVSAPENSNIFSAGIEPINFILGRENRLIVQALKTAPIISEKNTYFGLVVRSSAASSVLLDRLPGSQYLGANFDVNLPGGRYSDVLNSDVSIKRFSLGNVYSFFRLRRPQFNFHPTSLFDTLRGKLAVYDFGLAAGNYRKDSRKSYEAPICQGGSLREFAKEHETFATSVSMVVGVIGFWIAFFGGRYYLIVERNFWRFLLCICVIPLVLFFATFIAHLAFD